jgi:hypothetical protein
VVVDVEVRIVTPLIFYKIIFSHISITFIISYLRMMLRKRKRSLLSERGSKKTLRSQLEVKENPLLKMTRLKNLEEIEKTRACCSRDPKKGPRGKR